MSEIMQAISTLPVAEKLELIALITEDINKSMEPVAAPDWQVAESRRRIANTDESTYLDDAEACHRLGLAE